MKGYDNESRWLRQGKRGHYQRWRALGTGTSLYIQETEDVKTGAWEGKQPGAYVISE